MGTWQHLPAVGTPIGSGGTTTSATLLFTRQKCHLSKQECQEGRDKKEVAIGGRKWLRVLGLVWSKR